jgi:hypothetical protein
MGMSGVRAVGPIAQRVVGLLVLGQVVVDS